MKFVPKNNNDEIKGNCYETKEIRTGIERSKEEERNKDDYIILL